MLSDSESDASNDVHQLTINEHYAKAFQNKKEREELAQLKEKYGSDFEEDEETDSESAESEDEDGEELTPALDAAILRTLAKIKRKDPEIYESSKDIFQEERQKTETSGVKTFKRSNGADKSKPLTIRQAALSSALNASSRSPSPVPEAPTHAEEQKALRAETIAAFHNGTKDDENQDEDDLLIPRERTKDELEQEEEEYHEFLQREVGHELENLVTLDVDHHDDATADVSEDDDSKKDNKKKNSKKSKKGKSKQDKEEQDRNFLMNYILNRGWIDRSSNRIPTYGEITGKPSQKAGKKAARVDPDSDADDGDNKVQVSDPEDLEKDNEFEDIVDHFESSYNFRFEEPDAATIKSYPRNLTSTVRRQDTTRKDARERRKERKEEELTKKREEVKRMKALKMKEIGSKLDRIRREGGVTVDDELLQELDLDGDWDPDAHDKQMTGIYGADQGDDEKPTWDDDISIGDISELDDDTQLASSSTLSKAKKKKRKKDNDTGFGDGVDVDDMDADAEPAYHDDDDHEQWDGTEEMRKRKLDEYMDELYAMDFNDIVGDMPTRFKYATVAPTSYSLTPAEILMATDAELNEFMGMKKFAPYRNDRQWDSKRTDKLKEFRQKLADRTGVITNDGRQAAGALQKKRKGKKERMKLKGLQDNEEAEEADVGDKKRKNTEEAEEAENGEDTGEGSGKRKRKRRRKEKSTVE